MNTEQIINELVLLIDEMPIELHLHSKKTSKFLSFLKSVLTIITTDEQKIKELQAHNENLKKENKYLRESLADERKHKEDMAVVRCKDCRVCDFCYPVKNKGEEAIEGYYCNHYKEWVSPNHYCSYGERRE